METQKTQPYNGHSIHQECLDSSTRSLQIVHQTITLGSETMEMLEKQGCQLEKIDASLSGMQNVLNTAERHLRGIKSIGGSIYNKIVPQWNNKVDQKMGTKHEMKPFIVSEKMDDHVHQGNIIPLMRIPACLGWDVQSHSQLGIYDTFSKTESKIDENLNEISKGMDILYRMAIEQNDELGRQNRMIDGIKTKVEISSQRISEMNREMKKLN